MPCIAVSGGHSTFTSDGLFLSMPLLTHLITSNCKIMSWIRCVLSLSIAAVAAAAAAQLTRQRGFCVLLSSGKDATRKNTHMSEPKTKSTQYVEKTRASGQDCFGIAGRLFVMARNIKGKNLKKKQMYERSSHTSAQQKPIKTSQTLS